jgi:hypothetical protein
VIRFLPRRRKPEPETDLHPPACPECGGPVVYGLTCHTYRMGERWYSCLPCDSAVEYICANQYDDIGDCDWRYTHGLNPGNPRTAKNEEFRPPWLPEGRGAEGGYWVMPGVLMLGA